MTKIRFNIYLLQILIALGTTITTYLFKYVIDLISENNVDGFFFAVTFMVIFIIIFQIFRTVSQIITEKYIQRKMLNIRYSLFKSILFKPPYTKSSDKTGDYNALVIGKTDRLETDVIRNKISITYDIATFIFTLSAIVTISVEFMIYYALIAFLIYFIPQFIHKYLITMQERVSVKAKNMFSSLQNSLTHVNVLFNTNGKIFVKLQSRKKMKDFHRIKYKYRKVLIFQEQLLDSISILTQISAYLIGGMLVMENKMSYGELIVVANFATSIFVPIVDISQKRSIIKSFKVIKVELAELVEHLNNDLNKEKFIDLELDQIGFEDIIKPFSFTFKHGYNYQFTGNSGVGKSVMSQLISGEKLATEGRKLVNNREVLYPNCCIITQETLIIEGTIRENILFDQKISDEKFQEIIKVLKIDEFYDENRILKHNDQSLSYGQKQRINIARALVHNFDLVILDEALNGLQSDLKHEIVNYFANLDVTLIIIAHDFTLLREDFTTIYFTSEEISIAQECKINYQKN